MTGEARAIFEQLDGVRMTEDIDFLESASAFERAIEKAAEEARVILERFEVRKSQKQKEAFRDYLCPLLRRYGYEPEVRLEKGLGRSRNIVVGDPETAKLIFTAHYDTCAVLPIPNFITPRNLLWYGLYQALLVLLMLALCVAAEVAVLMLWPDAPFAAALGAVYLMLAFCLWWMLDGKANRHTANDNTSGVVTLTEILLTLPEGMRNDICCIYFDNEEKGLLGSRALAKRCKHAQKRALVVNFDCVSDGDSLQFFPSKAVKKEPETLALLEKCFVASGGKTSEVVRSFGLYPSDQACFARGVGVCALKKSKIFGWYMDRIHTGRDRVFDERNIGLLREGALYLALSIC